MDSTPTAVKSVLRALGIFEQDLEAIPAEAFDKCLGGKARTVADIVHEVNLVNEDIRCNMIGQPTIEWPDGWVTAPEGQRTKDATLQAFRDTSARLKETISGFTDEDLSVKVTTEHGETDRAERCRFISLHVWYHSGQLNFIQTLLGDDGWHWS